MGFDLYGERPKKEVGEYFRNSVWWWRPLWDYVTEVCKDVLTKGDVNDGYWNNGHWIHAKQAKRIAERLTELLNSGKTRDYEESYAVRLTKLPLEKCDLCQGTGKRNDEHVKGKCNGCDGCGHRAAWATHYPFSESNVREFVESCKHSGGFRIF